MVSTDRHAQTHPHSAAVVQCRLRGQQILLKWLGLLRCWATAWLEAIPEDDAGLRVLRRRLMERNTNIQRELSQIFSPYYRLCRICASSCCVSDYPPECLYVSHYDSIDALLRGVRLQPITHRPRFSFRYATQRVWPRSNAPKASPDPGKGQNVRPCPALRDHGCGLPWGERTAFCILFLCKNFAAHMTWRDYWQYVGVSAKYLAHLSLSLQKIAAHVKNYRTAPALPQKNII